MRTHARILLFTLALSAVVTGCADDLPKATLIEQMRILGVTFDVVGDPGRATPQPGEELRARFELAFPTLEGTAADAQMLILSCTGPDRFTGGTPICQEFIDAAQDGDMSGAAALVLSMSRKLRCRDIPGGRFSAQGVTVQCVDGPPEATLPLRDDFAARQLLFLGVICETGDAFVDPTDPRLFGCDNNDGETRAISGLVPVQQRPEDENRNPDASAFSIELDIGGEWTPVGSTLPPEDDCATFARDAGSMLPLADFGRHDLTLRFSAAAREQVTEGDEQAPEPLEISIAATDGEMERRFTLFMSDKEPVNGQLESVLEWRPPPLDELPAGGRLVRFFVTLRDQRGGFALIPYALCITK